MHRFIRQRAIAQDSHKGTLIQSVTHLEHRINGTQRDNVHYRMRVDGRKYRADFSGILGIHGHGHAHAGALPAERAQNFKAANMRTHQETSRPTLQCPQQQFFVGDFDRKFCGSIVEQIDPVVNAAGKIEQMPVQVATGWLAAKRAVLIAGHEAGDCSGTQPIVTNDQVQNDAADRAATAQ